MKPDQLLIIAAVGAGAYLLYTKMGGATPAASTAPPASSSSGFAMPGGSGVLSTPSGAVGAKVDPASFPTTWTPGASVPISAGSMDAFKTASGFAGLSSARRKRPTVQPGVVPVRANPVSQRIVGWNV